MTKSHTPTIAFCVIAKDREKEILRMLDSTEGVFDLYCLQDTGSSDKTVEVFQNWCKSKKKRYKTSRKFLGKPYKYVTVNNVKILGDFAKARNDSFRLARAEQMDYAMWLDSDDILMNPQGVKSHIGYMYKNGINLGIMTYIYAKGDGKIKPVIQKRERIIDLGIQGKWINRVHENFEARQPTKVMEIENVVVQHERTGDAVLETGRRNHLILKQQEKEEGIKSFTNKMLQDYAYDYWEHSEFKQAIKYYKIFQKRKNLNPEALYYSHIKASRSYIGLNDYGNSIVHANKAMSINSKLADPYLIMAEVYTATKMWDEAIHFSDKVLKIGKPKTTAPVNEYEYLVIPRRIKVNAYLQMGDIGSALGIIRELLEISPDDNTRREYAMVKNDQIQREAIVGINSLVKYLQSKNKMKYVDRLREAIPFDLLDHPTVRSIIVESTHDWKRKVRRVKFKGRKSIVFYAGEGVIEPWDGESDVTRGIGGSEGMCIQLSRELAKNNKVVVYNDCDNSAGKVFNNVLYEHYSKWDSETKSDVFVSLRRPDVFQKLIKARKQYLWLHDTGYGDIPMSLLYAPNKVVVLSEAHKDIIKRSHGITDDSIFWVTRNGLNPISMDYALENSKKRNPYQLIYASSYDRGLDHVLAKWSKIKDAVPEATLKIFYGWNTYDKLMKARNSEEMARYKTKMIDVITNSDGVQELGRVSQNDLYKEFAESSIWFYPSEFYEISCINAMSSQALGCVPVCTPHAALNETVSSKYGMKVQLSNIEDAVIYLLKNQEELEKRRKPMSKWASKEYDMAELGKIWDKQFNEG